MKKVTWSLKSKTKACPRAYSSVCCSDDGAARLVSFLKELGLANNGRYQIATCDQVADEGLIELPEDGTIPDLYEIVSGARFFGTRDNIYLNLPGLRVPLTSEQKSTLEAMVRDGVLLSRDGNPIGDVQNYNFVDNLYQVRRSGPSQA